MVFTFLCSLRKNAVVVNTVWYDNTTEGSNYDVLAVKADSLSCLCYAGWFQMVEKDREKN